MSAGTGNFSFSWVCLWLVIGGIIGYVVGGFMAISGMGETPSWVPPLGIVLLVCSVSAFLIGLFSQIGSWIGIV